MCDEPTLTAAEYRGRLVAKIAEYGWAIQFVEPERRHPSLMYTMGLTDFNLPELSVRGMPLSACAEFNQIAQECVDGGVRVGSCVELMGRLFRLVPQKDTCELLGAVGFYGSRLRALRLRPTEE